MATRAEYEELAEAMITELLLQNDDPGVRAIASITSPSQEHIARVADVLEAKGELDDIPEQTDFSKAVVGRFYHERKRHDD